MDETASTNRSDAAGLQTLELPRNGDIPNNPDLPVMLMKGAVDPGIGPSAIRDLLERNGWGGTWEYTVFDYHHYHPNAHEALVVARGWADLTLGGPGAETLRVEPETPSCCPPEPATAAPTHHRTSRSAAPTHPGRRATTPCAQAKPGRTTSPTGSPASRSRRRIRSTGRTAR